MNFMFYNQRRRDVRTTSCLQPRRKVTSGKPLHDPNSERPSDFGGRLAECELRMLLERWQNIRVVQAIIFGICYRLFPLQMHSTFFQPFTNATSRTHSLQTPVSGQFWQLGDKRVKTHLQAAPWIAVSLHSENTTVQTKQYRINQVSTIAAK